MRRPRVRRSCGARLGRSLLDRRNTSRAVSPGAGCSRRRTGRPHHRHDGRLRWGGLGHRDRRGRRRSDSSSRPPARVAGCLLATDDPRSRFARPRDEPEVAGRRKHRTAGQQQAQGRQDRRPAEYGSRTVTGTKGRVQSVPDSLAFCWRQLFQRLSSTHERGERPQLPVLR